VNELACFYVFFAKYAKDAKGAKGAVSSYLRKILTCFCVCAKLQRNLRLRSNCAIAKYAVLKAQKALFT
jgi:hypothetical protein